MKTHAVAQRVAALFFAGAIAFSCMGFLKSPVARRLERGGRVSMLLFGIDAADASHHTDTLMVGVWDPSIERMSLLAIPRDTRVHIPGYRFRRINEIYGYHLRKSDDPDFAAVKVAEGVEALLSSENDAIVIPYFFQVDFSAFRKLVDIIGGVWVTVKTPMDYDDFAGGYHIHKKPGRYLMDGTEALNFVRYRGKTGDRGRIYRTQSFLRAMAKRTANPVNVLRFPKMITSLTSSVRTNLSLWDMIYLTLSARKIRVGGLKFYILPGVPRGPYWRIKKGAARNLAAALILGRPLKEESLAPIVPLEKRITVRVFNASGRRGLARQITRVLRSRGYDVVDWGNYPIQQAPTRVIDRVGRITKAQAVAEELGIETYHSEPNKKALADVEVVIGQNFQGLEIAE